MAKGRYTVIWHEASKKWVSVNVPQTAEYIARFGTSGEYETRKEANAEAKRRNNRGGR